MIMRKRFYLYCTLGLFSGVALAADDKPVETRINTVKLGATLSFNYSKPIFKGIDSTSGYSLVPSFRPRGAGGADSTAENPYRGPLKFLLRPKVSVFNQGYDASDSAALTGMKDRDKTFNVGLRLHTRTAAGSFVLSGSYDVTGKNDGFEGSLMYTNLVSVPATRLQLYPEVGVNYWSGKVSDYYFGVEADEVISAGMNQRSEYHLGSTSNYFVGYRMEYPLTKRWSLTHKLHKTWFDDQILDSPVVDDGKESDLTTSFGIRFSY
jgi:outer membrane protein